MARIWLVLNSTSDLNHEDFLRRAGEDPGLQEVYRDDQAVVFQILEE